MSTHYEEGREAFDRDIEYWSCPYEDGTTAAEDWLKGWVAAADEATIARSI